MKKGANERILRKKRFSQAQNFSMGLRSGEYGGRKQSMQPAFWAAENSLLLEVLQSKGTQCEPRDNTPVRAQGKSGELGFPALFLYLISVALLTPLSVSKSLRIRDAKLYLLRTE